MIYFARAGDTVKIGRSGDPERRVAQLRTMAPALRLICEAEFPFTYHPPLCSWQREHSKGRRCSCEPCSRRRAEGRFEKKLHWHFSYCCIGGENFTTNPHLETVIDAFRFRGRTAFVEFERIHSLDDECRRQGCQPLYGIRGYYLFSAVGRTCAGRGTGCRDGTINSLIVTSLLSNNGAMTKHVKPI